MDQLFLRDNGDTLNFVCAKAQMGARQSTNTIPGAGFPFEGAWGFAEWQQAWLPYAVLGGMTVLTLTIMMIILRKKDPV